MKDLKNCTILLVDDTKYNIDILVDALRNDYKLSVALDGLRAIEFVKKNPPDLILLDIMMPIMDGFETCQNLKADPVTREIPIIFISAMDEPENITKGFETGAVDYVTKPFNMAEVKARVKTHLSLKVTRDEIKKQNLILEDKVHARTIELEKMNEQLRNEITERKRMQEQLIRSKCLISTGQLAVSVAHEINSPLQGIVSLLKVMELKHEGDKDFTKNMDMVNKAFTRIGDTVKKLLDLNRPGKENKQTINVDDIIDDTLALLNSFLKRKKIDITVNQSYKLPDLIASPQQIGQVFMNMINNSVEAMIREPEQKAHIQGFKKNGELVINTFEEDGNVVIMIIDTGPGISEEDMVHIFEPFYTSKKKIGMGVGLSICLSIIEDHNGTIAVKNSENGGAEFKIELPVSNTYS